MKNRITIALLAVTGLFFASCEKENEIEEIMATPSAVKAVQMAAHPGAEKLQQTDIVAVEMKNFPVVEHNLRNVLSQAVEETPCGPTNFAKAQDYHLALLGNDLVPIFGGPYANYLFGLYMDINHVYTRYLDREAQYFGAEGEYTNFMIKRQRELEKFWNMPNEIRVNGQHTATLNDREKVANALFFAFGVESREVAYEITDELLYYNSLATQLPDNPFFAADGFATSRNLIVIGDGIVQLLSETGIDEGIVWTGILAHEWAHQIQFNNSADWYPNGAADNAPEATRYTELEADFMAAYYMTHKRGATYNWKRVEQFYELFFNIGDCGFDAPGHHGTPDQRFAAARLGYELANDAQKQGHILTEQELHEIFVSEIIDPIVSPIKEEKEAVIK